MNPEIEVEGDEEIGDTTNVSAVQLVIAGQRVVEPKFQNVSASSDTFRSASRPKNNDSEFSL